MHSFPAFNCTRYSFIDKRVLLLLSSLLIVLTVAACNPQNAPPTATPLPSPVASGDIVGVAAVDELEIHTLESFPVQVEAVARGMLPDDCTKIGDASVELVDDSFMITVTTVRPAVAVCNEVETPFEETIPVDAVGLPAGIYTVLVNGVGDQFELSVDNVLETETPEPEPAASEEVASASMTVEELSAATAAQNAVSDSLGVDSESVEIVSVEAAEWPDACLGLAQENELCLLQVTEGYRVTLSYGDATYVARTDVTGQVVRPETTIEPVLVEEPTEEATPPESEQTPPAESAKKTTCTDKATFIKDITIKDKKRIQPNKEFKKTWRLRNSGTCTWTTAYQVEFARGEQMQGTSPVALSKEVPPGKTIDVTISMVAPDKKGTYKGFWQFKNEAGQAFGIGKDGKTPFWVQIVVPKNASKPAAPKKALISGFTWHDLCANNQEGEAKPETPPPGCVEVDGEYIGDGVYQEGEPRIGGMEVTLGSGACPSSELATTIATGSGVYAFKDLDAGTYCVTIDPLSTHNIPILIPGVWTYPASRDGRQTVIVAAGDQVKDANFGWDYQFAP